MNQVTVDYELRRLLQTARQSRGLTQKEAAARAGIDQSWWKKLESGRRTITNAGTVALMAYAAGVAPVDLDKSGWHDIADRLRILLTRDALPELDSSTAEEHLARTPGTTVGEREELILKLRELRSIRYDVRKVLSRSLEDHVKDPLDAEFLADEK